LGEIVVDAGRSGQATTSSFIRSGLGLGIS
jgi:hypothetical protein